MDTIAKYIDMMNEFIGQVTSFLVIPLVGVVFYEVLMRYAFNAPTVWGFEMTAFIYGVHYMLGLALTEGRGGHVTVGVITDRLPKKVQALLGIITSLVIFMPVWICMAIWSWDYAITSTMQGELNSTSWAPPVWPLKILMAIGFTALLLQGLSTLFRHIETFKGLSED